jgi:hypothetical protein
VALVTPPADRRSASLLHDSRTIRARVAAAVPESSRIWQIIAACWEEIGQGQDGMAATLYRSNTRLSGYHVIYASDRAVLVGEQDFTDPLRDLVTTILAAGGPP